MTTTDSKRWAEYKKQRFGDEYMIWHDGLDTSAVTWLSGAERDEAVEVLRLGSELGDSHAAQALAAMGDRASLPWLRRQLEKSRGGDRVRVALAIHALSPDSTLASCLTAVLKSTEHWGVRIDAAIGLRHFCGLEDEQALLEALSTPEYLVRYHAAESLLVRGNVVPPTLSSHHELFRLLSGPTGSAAPTSADFERFAEGRRVMEVLKTNRR